jgi:hypothetical protein
MLEKFAPVAPRSFPILDIAFICVQRFTCKCADFRVEPRGFEPLTSAVQSRREGVADVRRCSDTAENWVISSCDSLRMFADVRSGWRQLASTGGDHGLPTAVIEAVRTATERLITASSLILKTEQRRFV